MNSKRYGMRLVVLMIGLIGFVFLLGVQAAGAAPTRWSRWWLDISFPNNVIDTQLVIQLGYTNAAGQHFVTKQQSFAVSCTAVGTPVIQNGTATFDGSSYFSCDVPSIKEKVAQMSSGSLIIANTSAARRPALTGTFSLDTTPNNLTGDNPLFHRDDIQFNLPLDVTAQEAELFTAFGFVNATSDSFAVTSGNHVATAVYVKTAPNTYTPTFTVDAMSLVSTPATVNGPFMISNLDSTVTIGYSPVSGKFFEGTLTTLLVDPVSLGEG